MKLNAFIRLLTICLAGFALVACSTVKTTLYPKGGDKYQVVATARSESEATQGAIKVANKVCQKKKKQLVVIKSKTKYQGSGKELGQVTQAASNVVSDVTGDFIHGSTKSNEDYKAVVIFQCK